MTIASEQSRATILMVEDDPTLATMVRDTLGNRGYCVWLATNAAEAEAMLDEVRPDLIVVDLMLPDKHGLLLCASLKERQAAPVIICSGTKRKEDPLIGFKLGADDFIAKPFSVDELEVRIEAALRRVVPNLDTKPQPTRDMQAIGDLVIERARCRVTVDGKELRLTPTEFRLLCALADRPDEVVSRKELAEQVWGYHDLGVARSLDVHMRRLRGKLRGSSSGTLLLTVRGFGYRLASQPELPPVALSQAPV